MQQRHSAVDADDGGEFSAPVMYLAEPKENKKIVSKD
jgi:hypothetical protein